MLAYHTMTLRHLSALRKETQARTWEMHAASKLAFRSLYSASKLYPWFCCFTAPLSKFVSGTPKVAQFDISNFQPSIFKPSRTALFFVLFFFFFGTRNFVQPRPPSSSLHPHSNAHTHTESRKSTTWVTFAMRKGHEECETEALGFDCAVLDGSVETAFFNPSVRLPGLDMLRVKQLYIFQCKTLGFGDEEVDVEPSNAKD